MKYLYFIRHGEQKIIGKYWANAGLTILGFRQATLTGKKMRVLGCKKIYSSDLLRAEQTSETINRYIQAKIDYLPELREINYGIWERRPLSDVNKKYRKIKTEMKNKQIDIPYPEGESGSDVFSRAITAVKKIVSSETEDHIAIVSHGELILTLICDKFKIGFEKRLDVAWLSHCGITLITYDDEHEFTIRYINDVSHLEDNLSLSTQ
jgi:broad specificity phosphatase PhoE